MRFTYRSTRKATLLIVVIMLLTAGAYAYTPGDTTVTQPRVDYENELVFLELWRGGIYIGLERVIPLDEFIDYQLREAMARHWETEKRRAWEQQELRRDVTGLIPDIKLPRLPVFGEGSRIDISGHDRITVGGRQTSVVVPGVERAPGQGTLPELKMEQQLAVLVVGDIGERTKVNIDHDSQREDAANRIRLTYEGPEDDIIQSVELGDTRLSIPGTQFTGDLPAMEGLFGLSARAKLGGVDLYAVASREESQGQTQTFSGRRRTSVDTIYARSYVRNRFFRFPEVANVRSIRVYVDDKIPTNNEATIRGIATVWPNSPDSISEEWSYDRAGGDFDLLTVGQDFVINPDNVIEFARSVGEQSVIGVVLFGNDTIGGQIHNDSLVMKMLKPEVIDVRSAAWDFSMRNVYQLRQQDVQLSSVRLYRRLPGETQAIDYEDTDPARRKFLELLGLDPDGDGRLQYPEFDRQTGLIRFPDPKPFNSSELSVPDSVLYRKYPLEANEGMIYYLVVEYSSLTEAYYLGQVDIESESERVYVDGVLWSRDVDYEIDYSTGLLSFRRELPPDAEIRVTFEYRPLFSLAQKSLVGTRAEWKFAENGKFGSSAFFRSEGMPDDRPTLGSEPFQRAVAATDASYSIRSNELTAMLDQLPLLHAHAPSEFSVRAEGAVSLPNPNTRGVAWLDDFESTTITRDMTMNSRLWSHASVPTGKDTSEFAGQRLWWWTPYDEAQRIRKDSVFGPAIGDEGRETQDFLRVVFTPDEGDDNTWAGIMHSPSPMGMNLRDLDNLEVIMRSRNGRGRMHVSIGMSIDEDAPRRARDGRIVGYNGQLDTEDRNGNGILDPGEDTGLDGVFGADDSMVSGDDGNDDYDFRHNQMGTENNGRLDSEDLVGNGFTRYNHYYETTIPLDASDAYEPLNSPWRLYRVSLDSASFRTVGSPRWEDIKYIRIWFDGFSEQDTMDFFSISFVGSRWREPQVADIEPDEWGISPDTSETIWLTQMSRRTNPDYVSPFEPRRDAQGRLEHEEALSFGYRNLGAGRRAIVNQVSSQRDDYRDYEHLRAWIHDDGNDMKFLLRIGTDSLNYYDYTALITDGEPVIGRGRWYEFVIDLDSFPVLKRLRQEAGYNDYWSSGSFGVRGNPSLAEIRYLALGIENHASEPVTGAVWFNDLRLSAPRQDAGFGLQASADIRLSDFISLSGTFGYSDPDFRRLSEGQGVKTGGFGTNYGFNARVNIDRLTPSEWGLSIPVSYGVNERRELPKFSSIWPDLGLTREEGLDQLTRARDENFALENLRKQRSGNPFLNYTLEAMGLSWRYRRGFSHSVISDDSSTSTALQWGYAVSPDVRVNLGGETDLALVPQAIRFGVGEGRNRSARISRRTIGDSTWVDTTRTVGHGMSTDIGVDYSPIDDLSFDYSMSTDRDLWVVGGDTIAGFLNVGVEAGRDEGFSASYSADLWNTLLPSLDYEGEYNDERPRGAEMSYVPYRNIYNSGEVELGLMIELPEIADRLRPGDENDGPKSLVVSVIDALDPLEFGVSTGRSVDIIAANIDGGKPAPWPFRLGFTNILDTVYERSSETRDFSNSWRASSGFMVRDFRFGAGYDWNKSTSAGLVGATEDVMITWPDVDFSIGRLHNLLKDVATDSRLSGSYRRRLDVGGNLDDMTGELEWYGRSESRTHDLNPLLSWQTTWKRRVSTTLSANYSSTRGFTYLGEAADQPKSENRSETRGGRVQASYSFSAPQGLRLPFLKGVRFSSDLRLSLALDYSHTARQRRNPEDQDFVPLQDDHSWSTRLTGAYMFSRAIEAGTNIGYSQNRAQTGTRTNTTDLDIWVLFRF